jgi:hypothetical protein
MNFQWHTSKKSGCGSSDSDACLEACCLYKSICCWTVLCDRSVMTETGLSSQVFQLWRSDPWNKNHNSMKTPFTTVSADPFSAIMLFHTIHSTRMFKRQCSTLCRLSPCSMMLHTKHTPFWFQHSKSPLTNRMWVIIPICNAIKLLSSVMWQSVLWQRGTQHFTGISCLQSR